MGGLASSCSSSKPSSGSAASKTLAVAATSKATTTPSSDGVVDHAGKWPKGSKHTPDNLSIVYDAVRYRRQPHTFNVDNFLVQVVLLRFPRDPKFAPLNPPDEDPSGVMPFYMTSNYNFRALHPRNVPADRPTRIVPTFPTTSLIYKDPVRTDKDVTFSYKRGEPDDDLPVDKLEELVCSGHHLNWTQTSGVFGTVPKFPLVVMKGSVIKSIDANAKPFAIPTHEEARAKGMLLFLKKAMKCRGEEHDSGYEEWEFDKVGDRLNGKLGRTFMYHVTVFELDGDMGFLAPTSRVVFISHRWLSPDNVDPTKGHPDDANNTKLKILQKFVHDDDVVFFDYWSIPQATDEAAKQGRLGAIHSLNIYVDWCSEFVALCPTPENKAQYRTRGWTNVEMVSALVPVVKKVVVNKWNTDTVYGGTADKVGFLDADLNYEPVARFDLVPPAEWRFTFPVDSEAVMPIVTAVKEMFRIAKEEVAKSGDAYVGTTTYSGAVDLNKTWAVLDSA